MKHSQIRTSRAVKSVKWIIKSLNLCKTPKVFSDLSNFKSSEIYLKELYCYSTIQLDSLLEIQSTPCDKRGILLSIDLLRRRWALILQGSTQPDVSLWKNPTNLDSKARINMNMISCLGKKVDLGQLAPKNMSSSWSTKSFMSNSACWFQPWLWFDLSGIFRSLITYFLLSASTAPILPAAVVSTWLTLVGESAPNLSSLIRTFLEHVLVGVTPAGDLQITSHSRLGFGACNCLGE